MPSKLELAANAIMIVSVFLAARNNIHTWWIGIIGCVLFGWLFAGVRLYAELTLQLFFIIASLFGWYQWAHGNQGEALPIRRTRPGTALLLTLVAIALAMAYGTLLHVMTNAYAPFLDSLILTFSILGQFLLMGRRIENWYAWLMVNTIAVPVYISRELHLTALVYAAFWLNAWYGAWRWHRDIIK